MEVIAGIKDVKNALLLTRDPTEIRKFMGLPPDDACLQTQCDVMRFCMSSSWYHPFQFANRITNKDGRKRWDTRPFYRAFVETVLNELNESDYTAFRIEGTFVV